MNIPKKMIFDDSASSNRKETKLPYDDDAFKRFFSRKLL